MDILSASAFKIPTVSLSNEARAQTMSIFRRDVGSDSLMRKDTEYKDKDKDRSKDGGSQSNNMNVNPRMRSSMAGTQHSFTVLDQDHRKASHGSTGDGTSTAFESKSTAEISASVQDAKHMVTMSDTIPQFRSTAGKENRTPRKGQRTSFSHKINSPPKWGRPHRSSPEDESRDGQESGISGDSDDKLLSAETFSPDTQISEPGNVSSQESSGSSSHVPDISSKKQRGREENIVEYGETDSLSKRIRMSAQDDYKARTDYPHQAGNSSSESESTAEKTRGTRTITPQSAVIPTQLDNEPPLTTNTPLTTAVALTQNKKNTSVTSTTTHATQPSQNMPSHLTPPMSPPSIFKTPQGSTRRHNASMGREDPRTDLNASHFNAKQQTHPQSPEKKKQGSRLNGDEDDVRSSRDSAFSTAQEKSIRPQVMPTTVATTGPVSNVTTAPPQNRQVSSGRSTTPISSSTHVRSPTPTPVLTATPVKTVAQAFALLNVPAQAAAVRTSVSSSGQQQAIATTKTPHNVSTSSSVPVRADPMQRPTIVVNNRPYTRLNQIGKGGSSKVYKVLAANNRIFALKRVLFGKADQTTIDSYMNEVKLLERLQHNPRIVRLFDSEIQREMGHLTLLLELGEIDLANLLYKQRFKPFNINFIRLYWEQMLEAVQTIHEEKIVHADLKPANFLLVEGSLKLIDFGIANTIPNDTTNIHREVQCGTANYMAPEAIDSNPVSGDRKMGRASDVWSLGCILYQMVYGHAPFGEILNVFRKMAAITNPAMVIQFPQQVPSPLQLPPTPQQQQLAGTNAATASPPNPGAGEETVPVQIMMDVDVDLVRIMKSCLERDPKKRSTIPELLQDPFLKPHLISGVSTTSAAGAAALANAMELDMELLTRIMNTSIEFGATHGKDVTKNQVHAAALDVMQQLQVCHQRKQQGADDQGPGAGTNNADVGQTGSIADDSLHIRV
ncbi:Dual-specificity kinase, spindle pole body (SPB) duplication and spindle checkpoint function [Mortierella polycephala]|uniref:Dual-specificity kinase, spindle pole body (SPB) duplication and spindle checkpoint function n=1 Tax=Mortierella polycephala TaxID=41804 RepID=A0A9P6QCY0_9FUNG|nr:Dual-specificity kinase, spindle pole body (SPB) duplication and spindle checkpoint function [Mortierella polycephala]